jgi:protease-4
MFDLSGFLGNKLGITFDEVRTGEFGDPFTVTRPLTEAEKNFIQKNLNDYYNTFTTKAAEDRGIAHADLQKVAAGRVWTGQQALDNKLVDVLGGFEDAVKIASEKANIEDDYKLKFYPTPKNFLEELMTSFEENTETSAMKAELGEMYQWYQQVKKIQQYQGAQARMPYELHFD